ncbi:signal transduction histidine kinase [Streptosporangium album]|uniref:histidine kinase n=1 Tax=Streptosporangium album TaxID=47479 RepID=A0A7W7S571_9ACTN|nr:histidine kinase [Streptosporangium album]MBB4944075.1 signal transduction histidine kinase [Streptosporangium album]
MHVTPPLPLLKRVPPGVWTALAWCAGLAFTFLMRVRLPGEWQPTERAGLFLHQWDGLAFLAVATALVLAGSALLRRRPLPALALLLAASAIASLPLGVGEIPLAQFLAVDVALYFIAATRPHRTGIIAVALALAVLAGYLTTRLLFGWNVGTSAELAVAMTAVIAWLIGNSVHQAHEYAQRLSAQAAAQAITDERLRIARELHDMVAHSIGIIALQAGAARRVIDTQPIRARDALGEIETAGRETLSGLRRVLGALRQAGPGQAPQAAPLDPELGLADVDRLAATTAEAGVRVDVRWRGERRPLPPDIDMSAYRIIQEAVTNVVRHAGAPSCRVSIGYRDEELSIEILDSGPGRGRAGGSGYGRAGGSGYGLVGMRERVGLLHGTFSAEPCPEGGFRVAARLPVPAGVR